MRIFLIRHGRQNSPLCNVNVPLSEEGRRQAFLLGERLKSEHVEALWSSDLIRAMETADIVNESFTCRARSAQSSGRSLSAIWKGFPMR